MLAAKMKKGGSFLVEEVLPQQILAPEDLGSEQQMYAKTAREFIANEVVPVSDAIEAKDLAVSRRLLSKAGELGLLMGDVPEEFGGLGLDKASCALIAENMAGQGSFQTMCMAHTGIGTLPVVYYGTPALKKKYLPGLADGSLVGAYCLTEPGAGSDALGVRTKAVLSSDGTHYLLNGTKQFITNGGFADVFTVFAKVDGEQFTGFVLDRDTPGLKIGPEEHKMGIRGSTTTTVILEDAQVPVGNVLGEIGKGHKIAFNILNIGRFKLGIGAVGAAKRALAESLAYTLDRKQFGQRIANFGAIREKLGQMFTRVYAAESVAYRTIGMIDDVLAVAADKYAEAGLDAIEEYSVECAMAKVVCSEAADYVTDEAIQCLGGYGYCCEYPMERYYRDNRIGRIYEGTNEINRIVVASMLLRKAAVGVVPLFESAERAAEPEAVRDDLLGNQRTMVANLKRTAVLVLGLAAQKYGTTAGKQQGIILRAADLVTLAYVSESTVLRALKDAERRGVAGAALAIAAAKITCEEAATQAESLARQCLVAMREYARLQNLKSLLERQFENVLTELESIAARLVELERLVV